MDHSASLGLLWLTGVSCLVYSTPGLCLVTFGLGFFGSRYYGLCVLTVLLTIVAFLVGVPAYFLRRGIVHGWACAFACVAFGFGFWTLIAEPAAAMDGALFVFLFGLALVAIVHALAAAACPPDPVPATHSLP